MQLILFTVECLYLKEEQIFLSSDNGQVKWPFYIIYCEDKLGAESMSFLNPLAGAKKLEWMVINIDQ